MSKILIYDVAAESGGAKTVLEKYYEKAANDRENTYVFVTSLLEYPETEHIRIRKLPWIKKSWLHRLFCDKIYMRGVLKEEKPDKVLSLQNIGLPSCRVFQSVYVHNAIPFTEHRFSFIEDRFLWVYQNIIGRMTVQSLKKVNEIIVQTGWMKDAVVRRCGISPEVVQIEPICPEIRVQGEYTPSDPVTFFYPAMAASYKNHRVILEACKRLKERGIENYRVLFTATENENALAQELSKEAGEYGLPISFLGQQTHEQMIAHYRESVLLFPSYLETVGLPLAEAQQFHAPIVCADCGYARETVGDYKNAMFFQPMDDSRLAEYMEELIG